MLTKIYANLVKGNGDIIDRRQIGTAILNDDDRISGRKFNQLKRAAMKEFPCRIKRTYITITTDDGREADFGGYPCHYEFVKFVENTSR